MKKALCIVLFASAFISCKKEIVRNYKPSFTNVTVDTLLQDDISIRALAIDGSKAWYAGSNGKYGWVSLNGEKDFSGIIAHDTVMPEFRSIAKTALDIFILNAGTPATLYKISKDGKKNKLVYSEAGEKVFYDCLKFYNDKEGIAMGDPMNGYPSILRTKDGGETWHKASTTSLPKFKEGEAGFAASNSIVVIKDGKTWLASGGKKSRIFYLDKDAKEWETYHTPIVQGTEMSGIFSIDFYDDQTGFAVGGNYDKRDAKTENKILTEDGGKTWKSVGENTGFGYASCVQFVPNSNGNELLTAGPSGIYYSFDRGTNWKQIYDSEDFHTILFADAKTIIAAGQNKIIRIKLK